MMNSVISASALLWCTLVRSVVEASVVVDGAPTDKRLTIEWSTLDELLGCDAFNEALFTVVVFISVYLCGRVLGTQGKRFGKRGRRASATTGTPGRATRSAAGQQTGSCAATMTATPPPAQGPANARGQLKYEIDNVVALAKSADTLKLLDAVEAAMCRLKVDSDDELVPQASELFAAALRACASRKAFADVLAIYDRVGGRLGTNLAEGTWTLLLWASVETQQFHRCVDLIACLKASGVPSSHDFVHMVNYCVQHGDLERFTHLVSDFIQLGCQLEQQARNRALKSCVNSQRFDFARALLTATPDIAMDAISFNILMKAYAVMDEHSKCLELYKRMRTIGVKPSGITYGVLLDVLVNMGNLEQAVHIYEDMKESNVQLNKVHLTTLIKGLVKVDRISDALEVLAEMSGSPATAPDQITFYTIMKAQSNSGLIDDSLQLLDVMIKSGVAPDDVVYNILLGGCSVAKMTPAAIDAMVNKLMQSGMKATTTTLSLLVKAFSKAEAWTEALEMLEEAPTRFGVVPEARLYGQLGHACAKTRQGKGVLCIYRAMLTHFSAHGHQIDASVSLRLNRLCAGSDTEQAEMIHRAVTAADGLLSRSAVQELARRATVLAQERDVLSWRRSS